MSPKYKPLTQRAMSWTEVEDYFENLNEHGWGYERMVELIQHIQGQDFASRLFGSVAMLEHLIVSIYNPIELNREMLRIQFDREQNIWLFQYHSLPYEKVKFERKYDVELGREKFDQFIEWIKW